MKNWTTEQIATQRGKVAIVTGSSSGIGFEAARVLAGKDATVIIAVRNLEKGKIAAEKIAAEFEEADLHILELDLADLASVKNFAEIYKEEYSRLDLLINNAGVMIPPYSKTKDGFELQFGTNHLGHFALTARLIDFLEKTADSRIVNVSSVAHKRGNINFDDLDWKKRDYSSWRAYGDSKIANLYFTYELQRKLNKNGYKTITNAAHPGWTATELTRYSGFVTFMSNLFSQDISMGALPTLLASFAENSQGGEYFGPNGFKEIRGYPIKLDSNDLSKDEKIAKKLWKVSEDLTGVGFRF